MANKVEYRDPVHYPGTDLSLEEALEGIGTKMYGKDVRFAIIQAIRRVSEKIDSKVESEIDTYARRINRIDRALSQMLATQASQIEVSSFTNSLTRGFKSDVIKQYNSIVNSINKLVDRLNDLKINMASNGYTVGYLTVDSVNDYGSIQEWVNNEDNQIKSTLDLIELICLEQGIGEEN